MCYLLWICWDGVSHAEHTKNQQGGWLNLDIIVETFPKIERCLLLPWFFIVFPPPCSLSHQNMFSWKTLLMKIFWLKSKTIIGTPNQWPLLKASRCYNIISGMATVVGRLLIFEIFYWDSNEKYTLFIIQRARTGKTKYRTGKDHYRWFRRKSRSFLKTHKYFFVMINKQNFHGTNGSPSLPILYTVFPGQNIYLK